MLIHRHSASLVLLLLAAGCGDDDAEVGASGVAGGKLIRELTTAELTKFCNWAHAQEHALPIRSACEGDAVFSVRTKAECEAERDTCITEEPAKRSEETEYARAHCANSPIPRPDCTSTVAQYEACIQDSVKAEIEFYGALTCDMVNPDFEDDVPTAPSCAGIDLSCDP